MSLTGIDANPHIVALARQACSDYPEINFEAINVLDDTFASKQFDIIICTLFAHHFDDENLKFLLNQWTQQVRLGIIINDLHRNPLAFHSIKILTKLFSKSSMVKNDAPVSVLRGFSKRELDLLMADCEVRNYYLSWCWAFRWLLVIPTSKH